MNCQLLHMKNLNSSYWYLRLLVTLLCFGTRDSELGTRFIFSRSPDPRSLIQILLLFLISFFIPILLSAQSPYPVLIYRYDHYLFQINPNQHADWHGEEEYWMYHGREMAAKSEWRSDGDTETNVPDGVTKYMRMSWNRTAIAETIKQVISAEINREPGSVTISRNESGAVVFEGIGMLGRDLDVHQAVTLTVYALENGVNDIVLPMVEIQPQITINDRDLQDRGIKEVLSIGESNFAGSPNNRRHNIAQGLSKFNGYIIPQGETFSFNEVLGDVNASTGYKPELVILGDKTLPEYGGGLCQVSTTAYRGIWEYGFPIVKRKNHSFAVLYYSPQGTDATIYPPHTDLQFVNDGPSDILIQTHVEGDNAYYIYYGLRDDRTSEIIGPYTWGRVAAPPDRVEYTTDLPVGARKKVGGAVPGLRAAWFRVTNSPLQEEENVESFYSIYEARPLYHQIGVAQGMTAPGIGPAKPSWIGE